MRTKKTFTWHSGKMRNNSRHEHLLCQYSVNDSLILCPVTVIPIFISMHLIRMPLSQICSSLSESQGYYSVFQDVHGRPDIKQFDKCYLQRKWKTFWNWMETGLGSAFHPPKEPSDRATSGLQELVELTAITFRLWKELRLITDNLGPFLLIWNV